MQGTGGEGGEQYRPQEISGGYSGEEGGGEEGGRLVMLFVCECMNVCCDQSVLYHMYRKYNSVLSNCTILNNVHVFMCSSKVILLHVLKFKIAATLDARINTWGHHFYCDITYALLGKYSQLHSRGKEGGRSGCGEV